MLIDNREPAQLFAESSCSLKRVHAHNITVNQWSLSTIPHFGRRHRGERMTKIQDPRCISLWIIQKHLAARTHYLLGVHAPSMPLVACFESRFSAHLWVRRRNLLYYCFDNKRIPQTKFLASQGKSIRVNVQNVGSHVELVMFATSRTCSPKWGSTSSWILSTGDRSCDIGMSMSCCTFKFCSCIAYRKYAVTRTRNNTSVVQLGYSYHERQQIGGDSTVDQRT